MGILYNLQPILKEITPENKNFKVVMDEANVGGYVLALKDENLTFTGIDFQNAKTKNILLAEDPSSSLNNTAYQVFIIVTRGVGFTGEIEPITDGVFDFVHKNVNDVISDFNASIETAGNVFLEFSVQAIIQDGRIKTTIRGRGI